MSAGQRCLTLLVTMIVSLEAAIAGAGCADEAATTAPTSEPAPPPATERRPPLPPGQIVAVPLQNREDPAAGRFQLQIVNGTRERFEVRSVQFVWDGFTTPPTPRDSTIVAGQTIDLPVSLPQATCAGDGGAASVPTLSEAVVVLGLEGGHERRVPVLDRWDVARRLYLDDCERQRIERLVDVAWRDLRRAEFEGRPVTIGALQLTRRAGSGTITLRSISNTIPYTVERTDRGADDALVVLSDGDTTASTEVRIVEGRCDPHALAEAKQPHRFVAQIDVGDGVLHPYIVVPPEEAWVPMRLVADEACIATGKVVFGGDDG